MDMVFTGNSLNTDREVERDTTTFLAQSVMSPNALGFLLQLGVIDPQGVAEWQRHLFKVFDVPNIERIVKMPPMPKIYTPEEIMNRLMAGEKVRPKQGEDHDGVIQLISEYLQSSKAMTLSPEIRVLLEQQIGARQTQAASEQMQQMIQQMMMQQMQQAGAMPPQFAPPAGMGGAPPQLSPQPRGLVF
jgi:hypothetical protein